EGGLDGVFAAADDEGDEEAGQGDEEAGLGGDERLGDAGGDVAGGLAAAGAGGESGEGAEHADDGAEQAHERGGGDQRMQKNDTLLDAGEDGLADLLETALHLLGRAHAVLGVADDVTHAAAGGGGAGDPGEPLGFGAELEVALAQEQQQLETGGVEQHGEPGEGHHDPAAAQPDVEDFFPHGRWCQAVSAARERPLMTPLMKPTAVCSRRPSFWRAMRRSRPRRMSAGMATTRPSSVVTRASEMPEERDLASRSEEQR